MADDVQTSQVFDGPAIEDEQLATLLEVAGPEGVREIMDAFWRSTEDILQAVSKQIDSGDFDEAYKSAHALKGSAANVGASLLASIARSIEGACKESDTDLLTKRVNEVNDAVKVTKAAVEELVAAA